MRQMLIGILGAAAVVCWARAAQLSWRLEQQRRPDISFRRYLFLGKLRDEPGVYTEEGKRTLRRCAWWSFAALLCTLATCGLVGRAP